MITNALIDQTLGGSCIMKKRFLSMFLAIVLFLSVCPVTVLAQTGVTASGSATETIAWSLSADGTLTFTGT